MKINFNLECFSDYFTILNLIFMHQFDSKNNLPFTFNNFSFSARNEEENHFDYLSNTHCENIIARMIHCIIQKKINQKDNFNTQKPYQIYDFKDQQETAQNYKNKWLKNITICNNKEIKQKYSQQLNFRLDPRDQLIEHSFNFTFNIDYSQLQNEKQNIKIEESTTFGFLCEQISDYLVSLLEKITSISFNMLREGKLTQNQTKDFASKNLLMNINTIYNVILKNEQILKVVQQYGEEQFKVDLCEFIDESLRAILQNLIAYYPQSPPTGASPKMKNAILNIDRIDNEELDFLMTHKLKILKQKDGDFTEFIMKVMNKVIELPNQISKEDPLQQTLFEKFVSFSQTVFWMSKQHKQKSQLLNKNQINKFSSTQDQMKISHHQKLGKSNILKYLTKSNIQLSSNFNNQKILENSEIEQKRQEHQLFDEETQRKKDSQISEMRKKHDFAINKKLPNGIQPFSIKNMKNKNFNVTSSSMLRMLTKWAQNLIQIFEHPQTYTLNRVYPFKTINHQIFHADIVIKRILYSQINDKRKEMQEFRDKLINNNTFFQSIFFSADNSKNFTKLINRYTQTRMLASNMNNLLIQLMKQFVSKLIHLLIEAGTIMNSYDNTIIQHQIDLVVFRLGDLMRSKVYCTQSSFVKLLQILYTLDEDMDNEHKQLVKLMKIKNKLNTKDSNILITYIFMGQIQCELQMSVQRMEHKQQNYNDYNHFLYELIRGKFGVLSQCATIVAQYDPIVSASAGDQSVYKPKSRKKFKIKQKKLIQKEMFICSKCGQLKQPKPFFLLQFQNAQISQSLECDSCRIKSSSNHKQQLLNSQNLRKTIKIQIESNSLEQISSLSYQQLKQIILSRQKLQQNTQNNLSLIVSIVPGSEDFNYELAGFIKEEDKLYSAALTSQILDDTNKLFQNKYQYDDLSSLIGKSSRIPIFTYIVKTKIDEHLSAVLQNSKLKNVKDIQSKIKIFKLKIQQQIIEQIAIKKIKNKSQTLVFNSPKQFSIFSKTTDIKNTVNLSSIQFIYCQNLNIKEIQTWIGKCSKLKRLDITNNQVCDLNQLKHCKMITELFLANNLIKDGNFEDFEECWKNLKTLKLNGNPFKLIKLCELGKLTILQISECKQLETIQFKKYPQLQTLQISNNQSLSSFQLKQSPQLLNLQIDYNQSLTSIQLPECHQLQKLQIHHNKQLISFNLKSYPQLQTLQIYNNQKLPSLQLKEYPKLQNLQLRQNSSLLGLVLQQYPELQSLIIYHNVALTFLSLNEYPKLKQLRIYLNEQLSNIKLQDYPNLQILQIYKTKAIILQMKQYPELQFLQICSNHLLQSLNLKQYPQLQKLQIYTNNSLTQLNLKKYTNLKSLQIYQNRKLAYLHIDDCDSLITLQIRQNEALTSLQMNKFPQLKYLKIFDNPALTTLELKSYPQLSTLQIYDNLSLSSIIIKQCPNLRALKIISNKQLSSFTIPNQNQLMVLIVCSNPNLLQIKMGQLPKLIKLQMQRLPALKDKQIHWQLSNSRLDFLGDIQFWQSLINIQPALSPRRIKQWNHNWTNLKQLQEQGLEYVEEEEQD